jgi:hypothetical protein
MPVMLPLMLRHPSLISPFMKAMPGMMRGRKGGTPDGKAS